MIRYAPIDIEKLKNLIAEIQENIQNLKELTRMSYAEFHQDSRNYALCEHHFRRALEGVLTAATHILSRLPVKTKDYQEIITSLGKYKVVPKDFAEKNKRLASYRNRLVHMYWEVSEEELYKVCNEHIKDLEKFSKYFLDYIRKYKNLPLAES